MARTLTISHLMTGACPRQRSGSLLAVLSAPLVLSLFALPSSLSRFEFMAKNPPGGQKKSPEDLAIHRVAVNLTEAELAKVEHWCTTFKISRSEFMRRALMSARVLSPPSVDAEALMNQVRRVSSNMNQAAHQLNALHARLDRIEKYRTEYTLEMTELLEMARSNQQLYEQTLKEFRAIKAILLHNLDEALALDAEPQP